MSADTLIAELTEKVGLEPVDAHRSAFTALACSAGWTKARVGRYLGISRARVGQKVDKLLHYATTRSDTPVLTATMRQAVRTPPVRTEYDELIEFDQADWEDLDFARGLIVRIEPQVVASDT